MYTAGQNYGKKIAVYTNGLGVNRDNLKQVVAQMEKIKKYSGYKISYKSKKKSRQIYHWVVSYGRMKNLKTAIKCSDKIARYLYDLGFQVFYGVHDDTDKLHSHFIMNSTSYKNGKKFHSTEAELEKMKNDMRKIIASVEEEYCC